MKVRSDFITNSSSSSYIIALKAEEKGSAAYVYQEMIISMLVDSGLHYSDSYKGIVVRNEADLRTYIENEYAYMGETMEDILQKSKWVVDIVTKARTNLEKGRIVLFKTIASYENEALLPLLRQLNEADNEDIVVYDLGLD